MVRKLFGVLCVALVLCLGAVLADEIMGTIVKVDTKAKTVTVKGEDGKETTYDVPADAKILGRGKMKGDPPASVTLSELGDSVAKAKEGGRDGVRATITRDDKTKKVTEIKTGGRGKGKGGVQ